MLEESKQKLNRILLILSVVAVVINLIILDVAWLLKPKKELVNPASTKIERIAQVEKVIEVGKAKEVDYRRICQEEITKALTTVSAEPKEIVKTVYQQISSTKQPSIVYIPLGGGVSTTNRSWSYVGGAEVYFDKSNYPGAKKISFEVFLRIKHSAGEANARLYDATHGVVITNSEVSAGSENFTLKSSPGLNLLDGNNLYQVQLRSSTGYEAYMDGARIKVEY